MGVSRSSVGYAGLSRSLFLTFFLLSLAFFLISFPRPAYAGVVSGSVKKLVDGVCSLLDVVNYNEETKYDVRLASAIEALNSNPFSRGTRYNVAKTIEDYTGYDVIVNGNNDRIYIVQHQTGGAGLPEECTVCEGTGYDLQTGVEHGCTNCGGDGYTDTNYTFPLQNTTSALYLKQWLEYVQSTISDWDVPTNSGGGAFPDPESTPAQTVTEESRVLVPVTQVNADATISITHCAFYRPAYDEVKAYADEHGYDMFLYVSHSSDGFALCSMPSDAWVWNNQVGGSMRWVPQWTTRRINGAVDFSTCTITAEDGKRVLDLTSYKTTNLRTYYANTVDGNKFVWYLSDVNYVVYDEPVLPYGGDDYNNYNNEYPSTSNTTITNVTYEGDQITSMDVDLSPIVERLDVLNRIAASVGLDIDQIGRDFRTYADWVDGEFDTLFGWLSRIYARLGVIDADINALDVGGGGSVDMSETNSLLTQIKNDMANLDRSTNDLVDMTWVEDAFDGVYSGLDSIYGMLSDVFDDLSEFHNDFVSYWDAVTDGFQMVDDSFSSLFDSLDAIYRRLGVIASRMSSKVESEPEVEDPGAEIVDKVGELKDKFPFSLPWDVARVIDLFVAPAQCPEFDLYVPLADCDMHVSFAQLEPLAVVTRSGTKLLMVLGLMYQTRKLIRGGAEGV